jgi:hypothetical protein
MKGNLLYICPVCFRACSEQEDCHGHSMLCCDPGEWGDLRRRPVDDCRGQIQSRAPRWFLEASGWVKAGPPYTPPPQPC